MSVDEYAYCVVCDNRENWVAISVIEEKSRLSHSDHQDAVDVAPISVATLMMVLMLQYSPPRLGVLLAVAKWDYNSSTRTSGPSQWN